MRSILAFFLVLPSLAAPTSSDVLLPGMKRVEHRLVLEPSELWTGRRIVAAPVRGFGGTHVVEPGVPFAFSTKYGTRLYVVPEAEAIPDDADEGWKASHLAADVPVSEIYSAPVASALESIVTTLRIGALDGQRFELALVAQEEVRDSRVLAVMGAAATLGLVGLVLVLRGRRRVATVP
jgi:hypothetical protein